MAGLAAADDGAVAAARRVQEPLVQQVVLDLVQLQGVDQRDLSHGARGTDGNSNE